MKTAEIIKDILEENGLTQQAFADILDVSQKAVSNWINEIDTPKASSMIAIYEKFGITPNELLGIEERKYHNIHHNVIGNNNNVKF